MTTRQFPAKAKRACDHCRSRKSACHIETAPPCRLCAIGGRQCTFNDTGRPRKRTRTPSNNNSPDDSEVASFARTATTRPYYDPNIYEENLVQTPPSVRSGVDVHPQSGRHATHATIVQHTNAQQQQLPSSLPRDESQESPGQSWLDPFLLRRDFDAMSSVMDPSRAPWMDPSILGLNPDDFNFMPSPGDITEPVNAQEAPPPRPKHDFQIVCGMTGDPDPFALRDYNYGPDHYMMFKRLGMRSCSQGSLPVNFLLSPATIVHLPVSATPSDAGSSLHARLAQLVSPDVGSRYIDL